MDRISKNIDKKGGFFIQNASTCVDTMNIHLILL